MLHLRVRRLDEMPKKPDMSLIGKKYNMLTVLELSDRLNTSGNRMYKCRCDCGNIQYGTKWELVNGYLQSCGCIRKRPKKDLSNKKFGKLTALYPVGKSKSSGTLWHCLCDCGNEVDKPTSILMSGGVKSCGCLIKTRNRSNSSDAIGVTFYSNKWHAHIMINRKDYNLGGFPKKEDAIAIRKEAEKNASSDFEEWYKKMDKITKKPAEKESPISCTPKGKTIREGNTYGNIEVESLYSYNPKTYYYKYSCKCKNCGHTFIDGAQRVANYARNNSCPECFKRKKMAEKDEDAKKHIGMCYGELEIVGYAGLKCASKNPSYATPYMICRCHECGDTSEISLARLKSGQTSKCVNCARKQLKEKRKRVKEYNKGASSPLSIVEGEANKNNSSVHKGVSWHEQTQKWRAYITFQRKQYNLGFYDNIDDALSSKKKGEEEMFESFVGWYKENYPTQWEQLEKRGKINE